MDFHCWMGRYRCGGLRAPASRRPTLRGPALRGPAFTRSGATRSGISDVQNHVVQHHEVQPSRVPVSRDAAFGGAAFRSPKSRRPALRRPALRGLALRGPALRGPVSRVPEFASRDHTKSCLTGSRFRRRFSRGSRRSRCGGCIRLGHALCAREAGFSLQRHPASAPCGTFPLPGASASGSAPARRPVPGTRFSRGAASPPACRNV